MFFEKLVWEDVAIKTMPNKISENVFLLLWSKKYKKIVIILIDLPENDEYQY